MTGLGAGVRDAIGDATSVVRDGLRLLWMYWPTLLTIYLLGQAAREASLWAAMETTKWSPLAGELLVPLAPLATVCALILALRVVAPSLKWANFQGTPGPDQPDSGETRARRRGSLIEDRLALLASCLIPFFAVYAAQGYLREDTRQFLNATATDEFRNNADYWFGTGAINFDRVAVQGWTLWGTVLVAFALRWLLDRFDLPKKHTAWGWVAAYVEITWVALFARAGANQVAAALDWLKNRQAAVSAQAAYESATSMLGPIGSAIDQVVAFVLGLIGRADSIIIVPMAWLTVGAVVYGRSLSQAKADEPSARAKAWAARMAKVPASVRKAGAEVFAAPISRFNGLTRALRTFARAGLAPMLLFCLVFVLAKQAEVGASWLIREVLGPQPPSLMEVIAPYIQLVRRGVYTVLMVALLAAAVDRILKSQTETTPEPDPASEPAGEPAT